MKEAKSKRLPGWLTNHFQASLDAHEKLAQVARLSEGGIRVHLARPQGIRALAKAKAEEHTEETKIALARAERDAALAEAEIESGFPVLRGFVVVAIWSWLEDFTKGLVAHWFLHRPSSIH